MQLSNNQILFIFIAIITITTGSFAHLFLPEKYYYDAVLIATDPYNQKGLINSYPVAMLFLSLIHI